MTFELLTQEQQKAFCSFKPKTEKENALLFNALNNPTHKVADFINKKIKVKDVYCEMLKLENEKGEMVEMPRVILFDDKGVSYTCVSLGVYSALQKLFLIYGLPQDWAKPIDVEIKQINKNNKSMLTLTL